MFEQAMRMFLPFGGGKRAEAGEASGGNAKPDGTDIDALRRQLDEMQTRLNKLSDKK
jgi:polyhydroxyalkanoate synthesis regulator protein